MQEKNMSEDEAYKLIRKYSMDNRKTMAEVADAIMLTRDIKR